MVSYVGVTGHQARPGIDWDWVTERMHDVLSKLEPGSHALTSLAAGSDQVFAREALSLGLSVTAVIPLACYERCFAPAELSSYHELLPQCERVELPGGGSDEEAFLAAGRYVADTCDTMVAVWDGKPAVGLGGTADVVSYCLQQGRDVIHIDTTHKVVRRLSSNLAQGPQ